MSKEIIFARIIIGIVLSCILSLWFTKVIIKKANNRQIERNYLESHKVKNGTVSGGGKAFFCAIFISFFISSLFMNYDYQIIALIFSTTMFFLIGFLDDYFKNKFKSYDGISARLRIILELTVLIYFVLILKNTNIDLDIFDIPILNIKLNLSHLYLVFLGIVLIGSGNAINLTDGLDGLASGLVMIAIAPFILLSLKCEQYLIAIYLSCVVGSLMGFLYYNFPPAKVFMGDCGSLYLGSVLGSVAIILKSEFILLVAGFLFVLEVVSVILQVLFFKTKKKRLFLMTPLHHHFEKKGIDEVRVVMGFYLVGIFFSIISLVLEAI